MFACIDCKCCYNFSIRPFTSVNFNEFPFNSSEMARKTGAVECITVPAKWS